MRLRTLAPGLAALLIAAAPAHAGTGYQGGPTHDGHVDDAALSVPLAQAWTRDLGATPTVPLVTGGRVFALAGHTLYALDRVTGRTLWERETQSSSLAFDNGRLFVTAEDQLVQALDPATGATLWTVRADPAGDGTTSHLLPAGGRLFTAGHRDLFALDQGTGATLWRRALNLLWPSALDGERVILGDGTQEQALAQADGSVGWTSQRDPYADGDGDEATHAGQVWTRRGVVLDAATGAKRFTYASDEAPAFGGGLAILTQDGALVAVDETTGAQRWTAGAQVESPPLVVGSTVFAVTEDRTVEAFAVATGAALGRIALTGRYADEDRYADTSLAAGEGSLLIPTRGGLAAYSSESGPGLGAPARPAFTADPTGGADDARAFQQGPGHAGALASGTPAAPLKTRWSIPADSPRSPLIADGKVFAIDSALHAYDARDGQQLWSARLTGETGGAAYDAGRVFVLVEERLRAYSAADGALLWVSQGEPVDGSPVASGGGVHAGGRIFSEADGTVVGTTAAGSPAVDGGTAWGALGCDGWHGVQLATGVRIDGRPGCEGLNWSAVKDGLVAIPEAHVVLDAGTGRPVDSLAGDLVPAFAHGLRFAVTDGALDATPERGGARRWSFAADGGLITPPLVVGRTVFAGSKHGRVYAVDADTGARMDTAAVGDELVGRPALAAGEGVLVVPTRKRLVALEGAGAAAPGGTAPQTAIGPLPTLVEVRDPLVSFGSDKGGFFECRLDLEAWEPCSSPHRFVGVVDGRHDVWVRAIDADGNADPTPAVASMRMDAAPETSISGPAANIKQSNPYFSFSAREPGSASPVDATFECRLDGAAWAACPAGWSATLADGPHLLEARATDTTGHTDPAPAQYAFTVDTIPPAPPTIDTGAIVNERTPLVTGHADPAGVRVSVVEKPDISFDLPVDASGAWSVRLPALDERTYTLRVTSSDAAGNQSRTEKPFTVALTEPDTDIYSHPDKVTTGPSYFSVGSTRAGATVECRIDGGAWSACASPYSLHDGTHVFEARTPGDPTPAAWTWRVDTTAPQPTADTPAAVVTDPSPVLSGSAGTAAGDTGEVEIRVKRVADGYWPNGAQTAKVSGGRWTLEAAALPDGRYYVDVTQGDSVENVGYGQSGEFTIAADKPGVVIKSVGYRLGEREFRFTPTVAGAATECRLDGGAWKACASPWSVAGVPDGTHRAEVRADGGEPAEETFTLDTTGPALELDAPADATVTDDTTPVISGRSDEPGEVRVWLSDEKSFAAGYAIATPGADGRWSVEVTPALAPGHYVVTASQQDTGANASSTAPRDLWVASSPTPAPAAPWTITPTPVPTWQAGAAPSPTATPTASATATPTASPSPTLTPTPTATASPTATPTVSPTATPTATATATPTASPTPSPERDARPQPSPSPAPATAAAPAPAEAVIATPRALATAIRQAARAKQPLRFSYRASKRGTLTVKTGRQVTRLKFRPGQRRTITIRGAVPKGSRIEVRFGALAVVLRA